MDAEEVRNAKKDLEIQEGEVNEDGSFLKKIPPEEIRDHVFINNYQNKKVKVRTFSMAANKDVCDDIMTRQITLLYYQASKDWSTFVFAVYNIRSIEEGGSEILDHRNFKKSYIIVRKSHKDMERIFASGVSKSIVEDDDYVTIIKSWDHVCQMRLRDIKRYQFENIADIEFESAKNTD